jgi:hypothetical protein
MPYVQLPGTKFVFLKTTLKNYTKVVQFLEGDKALLGHRGSRDAFKTHS